MKKSYAKAREIAMERMTEEAAQWRAAPVFSRELFSPADV